MESDSGLKLIQKIDTLINDHQINEASEALESVDMARVPSRLRSRFSALCVRVARPDLSMKFLWKSIFEASRPEEGELFEYACSLRKAGLVNQSLQLFDRLRITAPVLLQQAFCHVATWNYEQAKELLLRHGREAQTSSKPYAVGRVNLASACVFLGEAEEARRWINEVKQICQEKHFQLYLNCLELEGQIYFQTGEGTKAREKFEEAYSLSHRQKSSTTLFIKKWLLLNQLKFQEISLDHATIREFLSEARRQGHWETLRDWHFQVAKITENRALLIHNYFGSPGPSFRKRILPLLKDSPLPEEYPWFDPRSDQKIERLISLYDPSLPGLSPGKALHRLMMALCSDFYRPWSVERIFDILFENETFDPFSSHKRVYKQIEDLKILIKDLPLEFKATSHGYRIRPEPGGCLILRPALQFAEAGSFFFEVIREKFKDRSFNRADLEKLHALSPSQWQRQLKNLVAGGQIAAEGRGKGVRYRIVSG